MIKYFSLAPQLIHFTKRITFAVASRINQQGVKKLQLYQKIKQKQFKSIKTAPLNETIIDKYYKQHRCDGCNSLLQTDDNQKYGYIRKQVLDEALSHNIQLIESSYGTRAQNSDSKTLQIIHSVQRELNIKIFNNESKKLDNLENVEVLLRLQQKIDEHEQNEQTIRRTKKLKREIYCYRCYSLKYHNKLPEQYDLPEQLPINNQQVVLDKVFTKHKNIPTIYLYLVDVLDISGSFQQYVFQRLLNEQVEFAIVINKLDIVNDKYLNKHLIFQEVKHLMMEFISEQDKINRQQLLKRINLIKIFMVSSVSKTGIKNLEQFIEKSLIKRIQLIGFPNTGKTTLLNELTRMNKPTSKVPGTTLYITENRYKKNIMYDMPGLYSEKNMYNLIDRPNLKALLAWNKLFSPPIMMHQAFFFGGKVEIRDVKIILFGLGGACASDNRWFMLNYKQFWKGLPPLNELHMTKYEFDLTFIEGQAKDLEISGWGFMSFRLAYPNPKQHNRKLTLYLPKNIHFHFRDSVLKDSEVLNFKSAIRKRQGLQRIQIERQKGKDPSRLKSHE